MSGLVLEDARHSTCRTLHVLICAVANIIAQLARPEAVDSFVPSIVCSRRSCLHSVGSFRHPSPSLDDALMLQRCELCCVGLHVAWLDVNKYAALEGLIWTLVGRQLALSYWATPCGPAACEKATYLCSRVYACF
jgi:hypothetical protein